MSLVRFKPKAHPQQSAITDVDDVDDRATHPDVFAEFAHRFGEFTLDVAAAAHNTKCERYFTREQDGLAQCLVEPKRDRGSGLRVEFLPGRMRFMKPGQTHIGPNERPPFGVCLLIWGLEGRSSAIDDGLLAGLTEGSSR